MLAAVPGTVSPWGTNKKPTLITKKLITDLKTQQGLVIFLASAPGQAPSPEVERALGSIKTMLLVALIFAIIGTLLELVLLGGVVFLGSVISKLGVAGLAASVELGFIGFLLLVLLVIDVLVIRRTSKMHSAAKNGDIAALKSLNSLGWAIVALIFAGVVAGVLLLIAYGSINNLPSPQA
jgi:hypothetical protein